MFISAHPSSPEGEASIGIFPDCVSMFPSVFEALFPGLPILPCIKFMHLMSNSCSRAVYSRSDRIHAALIMIKNYHKDKYCNLLDKMRLFNGIRF